MGARGDVRLELLGVENVQTTTAGGTGWLHWRSDRFDRRFGGRFGGGRSGGFRGRERHGARVTQKRKAERKCGGGEEEQWHWRGRCVGVIDVYRQNDRFCNAAESEGRFLEASFVSYPSVVSYITDSKLQRPPEKIILFQCRR